MGVIWIFNGILSIGRADHLIAILQLVLGLLILPSSSLLRRNCPAGPANLSDPDLRIPEIPDEKRLDP